MTGVGARSGAVVVSSIGDDKRLSSRMAGCELGTVRVPTPGTCRMVEFQSSMSPTVRLDDDAGCGCWRSDTMTSVETAIEAGPTVRQQNKLARASRLTMISPQYSLKRVGPRQRNSTHDRPSVQCWRQTARP